MDSIGILLFAVAICLVCTLLKELKSGYVILCSFLGAILILLFSIGEIEKIKAFLTDLQSKSGLPSEYSKIIFKILGICILGDLSISLCKDNHYSALADSVEIFCKCTTIGLAIPIFKDVITIIEDLLL